MNTPGSAEIAQRPKVRENVVLVFNTSKTQLPNGTGATPSSVIMPAQLAISSPSRSRHAF